MNFISQLNSSKTYLNEITRIEEKYYYTDKMLFLRQDDVTLSHIVYNKEKVAKQLAKSIQKEEYEFKPAKTQIIKAGEKNREIFVFRITDFIIHGAVASILTQMASPYFSSTLFSYRKEMSIWDALKSFSKYLKDYNKKNKERFSKGLYVLRLDVSSYTDTIPVGDSSPLWDKLSDLYNMHNENPSPYIHNLIKNVIRPDIRSKNGALYNKVIGIPTGSPVSTFLFNFYLMDLDQKLEEDPDAFVARYADDICIASPDYFKVENLRSLITKNLGSLKLSTNDEKTGFYYFNKAGRLPDPPLIAKGISKIEYLGCQIDFQGTVSLNSKKVTKFLNEVKKRIKQSIHQIKEKPNDEKGRIICSAITNSLDPFSTLKLQYADYLSWIINDRGQLKHLDYFIALLIAQKLTGIKSVRAFRKIPYRKIRNDWKLHSLVVARNRHGKQNRA